ncbi:MAG TPA: ATP-binding cassette domain-containing protein, partial [Ilumatobacteraceae bacterium]|nr:ATP-binding cassette domain-containing protein [Ilumatobacteraceae bacterium]
MATLDDNQDGTPDGSDQLGVTEVLDDTACSDGAVGPGHGAHHSHHPNHDVYPLLDVQNVSVRFGGIVALDGLSFTIDDGQICGLIGPNGAGKTTMFNVISRIYDATDGRVLFRNRDLLSVPAHGIAKRGIARTFQNLALFPTMTLLENVMVGAHSQGTAGFWRSTLRIGTR